MAVGTLRIIVKGKNLDVTPALRNYAEKKISKLGKFFGEEREIYAEALMAVERELQIVEITLQVGGLLVRGESKTEDMYASIDEAVDKIERQIRKYKTKIHRRLTGPKIGELGSDVSYVDTDEDDEPHLPKIVRTKRFAIKPMSVEEAIMQMDLLGHDFFVFANASTDEVNVVYRRKDGNYGLIEPEF